MELAMATDYAGDTGNAEPSLRRISQAGFRHIQWIHHWRHDFIYTRPEVQYITDVMAELDLSLYDIHAPSGAEKNWFSPLEYQRLAGVEIVKNRVEMCRTLGGCVVVTHIPEWHPSNLDRWELLRKSLDDLQEFCLETGVRIAVENRDADCFDGILGLFEDYDPSFLGLCYDSGHGNIGGDGLARLEEISQRLISVHLHDNDGRTDQHKPIFSGTVDWPRLAGIIARSPYDAFLTFETDMHFSGVEDDAQFLGQAYTDGLTLLEMVESATT